MKIRVIILLIVLFLTYEKAISQQTFYDINSIQKIEIFFSASDWKSKLDTLKSTTDGYLTADSVRINGTNFPQSNVKFKGNSSYDAGFAKNPFTIKLDKNINQSYQGIASIKLSNIYQDPSVIREALAYHILSYYMHCPRANFAQVYVNGTLQGLYTNVEDVTKTFAASHFKSTKSNTFIKCNPTITPGPNVKSNLKYISTDTTVYSAYYELESNTGWTELAELCNTITNNPDGLASKVDIDRVLWMMAFNTVTVNLDSYLGAFAQNYFMFKDNSGVFNPVVWDLNMSFGGFPYVGSSNNSLGTLSITQEKQLSIFMHENDNYWPLIKGVLSNSTYKRMYVAHIKTLLSEMFTSEYYKTYATTLQNIIDSAVASDTNKFYSYNNFQNGLTSDISVGSYSVPGIINLMDARATYLNTTTEITATAPLIKSVTPSLSKIDSIVTVVCEITDADSVWLGYRLSDSQKFIRVAMYDDGMHGDGIAGDHVFGVAVKMIPEQSQYYIYAENNNAGIFSPARSEHEYHAITLSTGVNEIIEQKIGITIYPNPAANQINFNTNIKGEQHFEVIDLTGKEIANGKINGEISLNTSLWKDGVYFMRIENTVQKIIIIH